MIDKWHDMLTADDAGKQKISDAVGALREYVLAAPSQLRLSALSGYRIYEITGADASAFLQGQFCNDLSQVTQTKAQITGYCTPKGRLLALPTITGFDGGYRLLVPDDVADAFIKRLSMFILRSSVTIKLLDDWVAVGLTGRLDGEMHHIAELLGPLPRDTMDVTTSAEAQTIRWHDDYSGAEATPRYLRLANLESQCALWSADSRVQKSADCTWRLSDISAGVPSVTHGVLEAFVPQMINLQLINALSFTKGCYPGQEIVARMQYLGKLKRHMRLFSLAFDSNSFDIDAHLRPGLALSAGADANAGEIVDAMPVSESSALVLAVTKVLANDTPFALAGIELQTAALPYALPSLEES